jgi:O-antigen/teichoic acid export membrane protein
VDNLAQQVLSFLVFLVLARLITPQDFGVIAVVHVLVTFFRQTVLDAIVLPVSRAHAATDALYAWAFGVCVVAAAVMALCMLGLTPLVARWAAKPELLQVLPWMALVVLAYGAGAAYEARLVRHMAFRALAIRSVISVTLGGAAGVALALRGYGVMALVAQQVASSCIALALLMLQSRWRPQLRWNTLRWNSFSSDTARISATGFMGFLASQGDTLLVSSLLGAQATGIYSFAKRLTSSIYLAVGAALLKLAISAFASAGPDPRALRRAYIRILGASLLLMLPMLVGLSVLIEPVIHVFFGDIWSSAAPIVALLSVMYLLLAANQINDYLLYAMGARSRPMQRVLTQITLSVVLGWAGAKLGPAWMAAGFALAAVLVWPLNQRLCNGFLHARFSSLLYSLQAPVIAACVMGLTLVLLLPTLDARIAGASGVGPGLWVGAWIVGGAVVYGAVHRLVVWGVAGVHDALREMIFR